MKKTMDCTFEEMANYMGVTVESLAQLPLTKVTEIFDNFREGKSCMRRFESDIVLHHLKKVDKPQGA
jgi:hypothetical protein